jgi:hypothetical protein
LPVQVPMIVSPSGWFSLTRENEWNCLRFQASVSRATLPICMKLFHHRRTSPGSDR